MLRLPSASVCVLSNFHVMGVWLLQCSQVVFNLQLTLPMKWIRAPTAPTHPPSLSQCCLLVAPACAYRTGGSHLHCDLCLLLTFIEKRHRGQITVRYCCWFNSGIVEWIQMKLFILLCSKLSPASLLKMYLYCRLSGTVWAFSYTIFSPCCAASPADLCSVSSLTVITLTETETRGRRKSNFKKAGWGVYQATMLWIY